MYDGEEESALMVSWQGDQWIETQAPATRSILWLGQFTWSFNTPKSQKRCACWAFPLTSKPSSPSICECSKVTYLILFGIFQNLGSASVSWLGQKEEKDREPGFEHKWQLFRDVDLSEVFEGENWLPLSNYQPPSYTPPCSAKHVCGSLIFRTLIRYKTLWFLLLYRAEEGPTHEPFKIKRKSEAIHNMCLESCSTTPNGGVHTT